MARDRLIDVTMPFGHPAGTWPGDAPLVREWTGRIGGGEWAVNLSRFCSSPHNGTHSDAPLHVDDRGAASESLAVEAYLGPCVVVDAASRPARPGLPRGSPATRPSDELLPESLLDSALEAGVRRVLFRTRPGPAPKEFPRAFRGFSEGLAGRLAKERFLLAGTDAPSVDAPASHGLPAHKALFAGGVTLLENLDLSRAPPGRYELLALPLKVEGLCAAPVRALLRPA